MVEVGVCEHQPWLWTHPLRTDGWGSRDPVAPTTWGGNLGT